MARSSSASTSMKLPGPPPIAMGEVDEFL
jgi:hypothetical protein